MICGLVATEIGQSRGKKEAKSVKKNQDWSAHWSALTAVTGTVTTVTLFLKSFPNFSVQTCWAKGEWMKTQYEI